MLLTSHDGVDGPNFVHCFFQIQSNNAKVTKTYGSLIKLHRSQTNVQVSIPA